MKNVELFIQGLLLLLIASITYDMTAGKWFTTSIVLWSVGGLLIFGSACLFLKKNF